MAQLITRFERFIKPSLRLCRRYVTFTKACSGSFCWLYPIQATKKHAAIPSKRYDWYKQTGTRFFVPVRPIDWPDDTAPSAQPWRRINDTTNRIHREKNDAQQQYPILRRDELTVQHRISFLSAVKRNTSTRFSLCVNQDTRLYQNNRSHWLKLPDSQITVYDLLKFLCAAIPLI